MASMTVSSNVDTKKLANRFTMHLKMKRWDQWKFRVAIGFWLMRLAARIMWIHFEIEDE